MDDFNYVGGELETFSRAHHWKSYWASRVRPHIQGRVLEVGAGIGSNTLLLRAGHETSWVCLEPDPRLAATLQRAVAAAGQGIETRVGTLQDLAEHERFETFLYVDVLEHIEDDRGELQHAAEHLAPGGRVVVLSPAHPWLFSPFDRSIGHFRRYTAGALRALTPGSLRLERVFYLDAVGLLASAANRLLLRQSMPTARQIALWDNCMVPCSRLLDPLTLGRLGKSVVAVWDRPV